MQNRQEYVKRLLLAGFLPIDLLDSRKFDFTQMEVFDAILEINRRKIIF